MNFTGTFRSYFGAIGVPILDSGDGSFSNVTHDWANATAGLSGGLAITIMRLQIRNMRVDIAKQRLAELALMNNCQFLLLIDDDVLPPAEGLMKMLKLWKSDPKYKIISGVYFSKSDPAMPLIFKGNMEGSYWDWTTQDLIEADGAGAGFLFIDTSVFKKMSKPWFSCDYFFEDPRSSYDLEKWGLQDALSAELMKGDGADDKVVKDITAAIKNVGNKVQSTNAGNFDPSLLKNRERDGSTTEDLYFFKKAREELGEKLWIDCSIQCGHQDKKTGRVFGIQPDMPQARPRYEGKMKRGDQVVVDIGAGQAQYWIPEGKPIRIDNDPQVKPDILCDARAIPLEDCFADMVFSSHSLEHFSFRETMSVLKEWIRILKVDGKLVIIVPNLKWAAKRILDNYVPKTEAERSLFMYYSAQQGDLQHAHQDFHKAGFVPEALKGILERLGTLTDIEVHTSDGNYGNWKDHLLPDDSGYNIIAIAKKFKHDAPVSMQVPFAVQEGAKIHIGEKANTKNFPDVKAIKRNKEKASFEENEKIVKQASKDVDKLIASEKQEKPKRKKITTKE